MSLLQTYKEYQIHALTKEQYRTLSLVDKEEGQLGLAYDDSASDYFFDIDTEESIDLFLDEARIVYVNNDQLKLASPVSLRELVLSASGSAKYHKRYKYRDFFQGGLSKLTKNQVVYKNLEISRLTGRLKGMLACCECGEPGCYSQYAWIEDNCCYVLFDYRIARLLVVEFFPFCFYV